MAERHGPVPSGAGRSRAGRAKALALACAALSGCAHLPGRSACADIDPVLVESSFVVVTQPVPGQRVDDPLRVTGCSRTFESNVVWTLRDRAGAVIASGHAAGGGVEGPAEFTFEARHGVRRPQPGHLEVAAPRVSQTEGFPPGRTVIPVVLVPSD